MGDPRVGDGFGSTPLLASGVGDDQFELEDGRLLTVPVGGDFEHGPLLLFPGDGGSAITLAPRVNHRASYFSYLYDVPGEIVYEAMPEDGPHALYRARLAP